MASDSRRSDGARDMVEELRSEAGPGDITRRFNEELIAGFRSARDAGQRTPPGVLLLTTTGARSGRMRTTPLVFLSDEDRVYVIASKAGADSHPAWYHNLVAHPRVSVERGADVYEADAVEVPEPERTRIYDIGAAARDDIAEYRERTTRVIPVVELRRA